jgi:hypothetical protein
MKTNNKLNRIQNSIKKQERTVALLKGMNLENQANVELAEKNLASFRAQLEKETAK